ncbi:Xenotropic and polytropic retrovirus receptor 1 [Neocucurbitaria cava]|uniref:Xenotropic and polytropic retrovirus receptor 1 n=1 Tax=Neocucurbitaria cava TaxID=798079 RepID=A0A9W8YH26_9PLEO|nr:Xenotropic and polytropic retrovirus receptor 1 [Neocucurbitaria cava]
MWTTRPSYADAERQASSPSPFDGAPKYSYLNREHAGQGETANTRDPEDLRTLALTNSRNSARSRPSDSRLPRTPEEEPLTSSQGGFPGLRKSYGSIIGSPPSGYEKSSTDRGRAPPSLKLPGAALDPENPSPQVGPSGASLRKTKTVTLPPAEAETDNAFEVGKTISPKKANASLPSRYKSVFSPKRMNSMPGPITQSKSRPSVRRLFSMSSKTPPASPGDVPLEAYRDLDFRQAEFFNFLDAELIKIEKFYKEKEKEATHRLSVLRDQLHIMRDRRLDEVIERQTAKMKARNALANKHDGLPFLFNGEGSSGDEDVKHTKPNGNGRTDHHWLNPIDAALDAINAGKYGKSTKNITQLATPSALKPQDHLDSRRDFARRPELPGVPYQTAKRKLKVALQEYYRGLELLKSYALLNRTAFRKINKKYDKTVNARPSMRYMNEKVTPAWFVNSDVIESHIRATEDLYARYFERGNHKVAVGKLRIKTARAGDYTDNTFRNGILLTAGLILGVEGIVQANKIANLRDLSDPFSINTSYLLQLYAGYFLANLLLLVFCLACRVWHETKINYVFIFEYDTRHFLDWRQLSEINFHKVGGDSIYLYYPVILIAISVAYLFNPLKIFYFRTRMWLLYSLWRLLLAGIYPVEWRDFYMGDMFCSLTYTMGNIALFFCLYARGWDQPGQCNSSHLRVLGFLTTLPGIWRALQCVRRYWDTGNKFPHLLNCGKYMATILFYVSLSVYRIDKKPSTHAFFVAFATINGVYTSFWDIYYDWSLGDPRAKHPFLRKELGYKKIWWYYTAMVIDPILRFNWVIYLIVPLQLQHSAVTSFGVSLSEICRRGMWSLFRVENEHCTNVGRFRASRDVPLPYYVPSSPEPEPEDEPAHRIDVEQPAVGHFPSAPPGLATGTDLDGRSGSATTRQRRSYYQDEARPSPIQRAFTHVGDIFRGAHAEDFERKRKPELGRDPRENKVEEDDSDDDDESDGEEERGDDDEASGNEGSGEDVQDDDGESALSRIREDLAVGMSGGREGDAQRVREE